MYQEIRLKSKKNRVSRIVEVNKSYIVKEFSDLENMGREIEFLKLLKERECNVPDIIKIEDNKLYMEDLGETTLLDWYEEAERIDFRESLDIIHELCSWLKDFYRISSECLGQQYIIFDVNFRNFILKDNKIYGIDFEEACKGEIEVDAGRLIAFALTYNPAFTNWKEEFAIILLNTLSNDLNIEKELIIREKDKELEQIRIRRK